MALIHKKPAGAVDCDGQLPPRHIAIIMDGNGRWASQRSLPRAEGHRRGAKAVRMVVEECRKIGVRYLTLFSFSTENWSRPAEEVKALMRLFAKNLQSETPRLKKNGVRLRAIGDLERLPGEVLESLQNASVATAGQNKLDLVLAISYGGREELTNAVREIGRRIQCGELDWRQISGSSIEEHLYAPDVPEPDLLIRTSGECRVSNFLLWQLAYTEIVISPVLWPDFSRQDFAGCLKEYARRKRRYGLTADQVCREERQEF